MTSWTRPCSTPTAGPSALTDEEILERLVARNAERAAEEAQGHIRWLRPEYQAPPDHASRFTQHVLVKEDIAGDEVPWGCNLRSPGPTAWPSRPRPYVARSASLAGPASATEVAAAFAAAPAERIRRAAGDAGHVGPGAADGRGAVRGIAQLNHTLESPKTEVTALAFWINFP